MTDLTLQDKPPSRLGLPGVISWLTILLFVAYLIVGNEWPELRGRHAQPKNSPLQMTLLGKYIVGTSKLLTQSGKQFLEQADAKVDTDEDRIDVAILAGEVAGKDEALQRLDHLLTAGPTSEPVSSASQPALIAAQPNATAIEIAATGTQPATNSSISKKQSTDAAHDQASALRVLYAEGVDALAPAQRQSLEARNDYFGRVALSFGRPDSDPLRAAVLHESFVSAVALYGFLFVVGLLAIVGLVLMILAIVFYCTGRLKTRFVPQPTLKPVFIEMFALYLLLFVLGSLALNKATHGNAGIGATWALTPILPAVMAWGVLRGLSWHDVLSGLGWFRGRGFWIEVPLGVVGYIAGLPIVGLGLAFSLGLMKSTGATPSHPIQSSLATASAWQLYGIAAVWAPIVEETMFRGALFNHLRRRFSWLISAPTVALIFAAIHPQGLTFIPALGSIAIVLAGIREWRGTIVSSIVAHGLNNATVVTLMLVTM